MPSVINTNISSLNAQRNLSASAGGLKTALERLSSGMRVNSAKDDSAGLAIATRMTAQSRGMTVAIRNSNDAISLAQTADGALATIKDHLLRMRDLAVQSSNATNTSADQSQLSNEFSQLQAEINRVYTQTSFNGMKILDSNAGALNFQTGANSGEQVTITTNAISGTAVGTITASTVTISAAVASDGAASAQNAITAIDAAIDALSTERSVYGAAQNRFEGIVSILQASQENQAAAASRIMDADYAAETANLTRAQILQQAGTAMLAQANSLPNGVLTLLRG
jgi:flagellin